MIFRAARREIALHGAAAQLGDLDQLGIAIHLPQAQESAHNDTGIEKIGKRLVSGDPSPYSKGKMSNSEFQSSRVRNRSARTAASRYRRSSCVKEVQIR